MIENNISILIVDDARFSSAVIDKFLKKAGYTNLRHAPSAEKALIRLEEKNTEILLADWMMPEMDGLELTRRVRQLDESANRYTYIILLTANDGIEQLRHAFDEGVDDFVSKTQMKTQLVARILAAERIVGLHNRILRENQMLLQANSRLRETGLIDPLTGLGNRRYAIRSLMDTLKHTKSRGGATCYMLIRMDNLQQLAKQHRKETTSQLLISFARRIRQLVRPLDHVARISPNCFASISHQPALNSIEAAAFKRIHQRLNLKSYKTNSGFIALTASISIIGASIETGLPAPETMMHHADLFLNEAAISGVIQVNTWEKPAQSVS